MYETTSEDCVNIEESADNPAVAAYLLAKKIIELNGNVDEEIVEKFRSLYSQAATAFLGQTPHNLTGCRQTGAFWKSVSKFYAEWASLSPSARDNNLLNKIRINIGDHYRQDDSAPDISPV